MKRIYNIYHTDFIILYMVGMLSKNETKHIPKSTLNSWKKRDYKNIVGRKISFSDQNIELIKAFLACQKLLNAAKGLHF